MQIRNLGRSGLRVSAVGLGCNNFGQRTDLETSRKVIHKALDLGITLFDTADIYAGMGGSETVLGQVLGDRRKDIVLATKFGMPMDDGRKQGASRRYIMAAVEASLKRLKTDYIDLYQLHGRSADADRGNAARARRPGAPGQGALHRLLEFLGLAVAEAELTARQLNVNRVRLLPGRIQPGDARPREGSAAGGAANTTRPAAVLPAGQRPADRQVPARRRGAGGHALCQGAGAARPLLTPRNEDIVEKLRGLRAGARPQLLELAFSWLAARPPVASVIAGATRPEQIEQNVKATAGR